MNIKEITLRQYVIQTSEQHYAMTGAVIGNLAVQATALAEACVQISLDNQIDRLDWQTVSQRIEQIGELRYKLWQWAQHEINVLSEYLRYLPDETNIRYFPLSESCLQICRLCLQVVQLLVEFRPAVYSEVQDDLDITITLLTNTAQAAYQLLAHNMVKSGDWSLQEIYGHYGKELIDQITHLENSGYV